MRLHRLFSAIALLSVVACLHAYEISPGTAYKFEPNERGFSVYEKGTGAFGFFSMKPEQAKLVKASQEDGYLVIDTREYFAADKTAPRLVVAFHGPKAGEWYCTPEGKTTAEKNNRLEVTIEGEANTGVTLIILSGKGKGWFQGNDYTLTGKKDEKLVLETPIPDGVEALYMRVDLSSPGIYRIKNVKFFAYAPVKEADAGVSENLIKNGGAEDGFYNTFATSNAFSQMDWNQKHFDFRGIEITGDVDVELDSTVVHSGRYSFKMTAKEDHLNSRFNFNPVKYIPGKPFSFTVWMKADKPMNVTMGVFLANALAAFSSYRVDTEWKQYEFYLPAWGEKANVAFNNGLVRQYASPSGVAFPNVSINENQRGTLWVDTVSCATGGHSSFVDNDKVHLRGTQAHQHGYYYAGETIQTTLEAENYAGKPLDCKFFWTLYDWSGKEVMKSAARNISFATDEKKTLDFAIEPLASLRGAMNLTFSCEADGAVKEYTMHFGVIDKNQQLQTRIGVEYPVKSNNVALCAPYLKDMRIGAVRIGTATGALEGGFKAAPYLRAQGIKPLFNIGMWDDQRDDQAKWDAWMKMVGENMRKTAGSVEVYESQNEVNICRGWTTAKDLEQIQQIAALIKENDPQAKLAGPCVLPIDFTWIEGILKNGGKDVLDFVSYHPYCQIPEVPDYTENARKLQQLIDHYKPIPQIGTEAGHVQQSGLTDNKITPYMRQAAAWDIRNIIQGFAGGVQRYYHFAFESAYVATAWNTMLMTDPSNDRKPIPNLALFAIRNLIDRIEDAPCVGRAKLGISYRCHIFDHGSKRTAALWKWQGEPSVMRFTSKDDVKAYDFCGTVIPTDALTINEFPIYLDSTLSLADFIALIENAPLTNTSGNSIEITPEILNADEMNLRVKNLTGRPVDVKLTILTSGIVKGESVKTLEQISGEDSEVIAFPLNKVISTDAQKVKVRAEVVGRNETREEELNLRAIIAHKTPAPLVIDGDLADWPADTEVIRIDKRNKGLNKYSYEKSEWGAEEDKITANLRYAWDDDHLYVAFEVFKPTLFAIPATEEPSAIYKYDSVQICFDTLHNAKPESQIEDDDFEYSAGQTSTGKPVVFCRWASAAVHDSLAKETGVVSAEAVPFAVKQYADRTVYEMAFTRRTVSPFKLAPNSAMRLGTIININNGRQRCGWLELTSGIGNDKRPAEWMDLVLLP